MKPYSTFKSRMPKQIIDSKKIEYQLDEYNLVSDGFFEDLMKKQKVVFEP
jgi:hypothetical protein